MPRGNSGGAGAFLDDLKARIGFGGKDDNGYAGRGRDRDDDYDDYEEYDDYDEYDDYGDYDDRDSRDSREPRVGGFRPITTSRSSRGDSGPNLVSIDDVKERTRIPDRLNRDPLATDDAASTTRYGNRTVLDETVPPVSSPAHNAALRDARQRSEGLDSLFQSTTSSSTSTSSSDSSYDPYEAYSSSNPTSHAPKRAMTVITPVVYGDVERVAKAVKTGDVVVLVMRNTPDDLSKRILDFSFGVASALDASVECPGPKVFAIARGKELSAEEKARLRNQGAL